MTLFGGSKTKWGALILGVGIVFSAIGTALNGDATWTTTIPTVIDALGAIVLAFGIRDWPLLNKK